MRIYKWLLAVLLILAAALFWREQTNHKEIVLKIGIFAGSSWNVPTGDTYVIYDNAIARFKEKHPNVKIEYVSGIKKEDYSEWLAGQVLQGTEPDVFMVLPDDFNTYASLGILQNLQYLFSSDKTIDAARYYRAALEYGEYEREQYALPFECVPSLMFVNKTLLAREGISVPDSSWTWQDFIAICQSVTKDTDGDGKKDQFGCYDYTWKQAAISNGLDLFNEGGRVSYFADSRMAETVQFMIDLKAANSYAHITGKDFDMGKVAFRPFNFAEYRTYKPYPWRIKKYSAFEWDCIKMPRGPLGTNRSNAEILLMGMSARTKNEALAWELLKEFTYDVTVQKMILHDLEGLPVIKEAVESAELQQLLAEDATGGDEMSPQTISEVMDEAAAPPKFKKYGDAMHRADCEIKKLIDEENVSKNSLNKLQKEINAYLQY
jgi:multiple sugar transport system substrate-binding protein